MDPRWEWEGAWEGAEPTPLPSARPLRCAAAGAGAGPWTPTVEAGLLYGWRSRMVQSRDAPGMHTNHANHAGHCPGIPHITYCWLLHGCSDAADLGGGKSLEAGRAMSPSPACLDRHTGTRICRLTTRTRGAIAGIHHEASRLPPPATPLRPPCGSRRRNVRSRDYDREAGRFLDVFLPGHLVSPLSPIHSTCRGVGSGRGSGKWDGGTHPGGGPAIDQRIQRSAAIVERGEEKVPVVSYSPGALRRRRPLEDEGGKGSGTWAGCAASLHMHNAE